MPELSLVLFDCDGTLIDSQHSIAAAMADAFAACALPPPTVDQVRRVVGLSLHESVLGLSPGLAPDTVDVVVAAYREAFGRLYAANAARDPLYPGAREAVTALDAAGCLLGIATGKSHGGVSTLLAGHGLLDRFITVQTPDTNPGKPHPGMIQSALAATGAERSGTCLIGDSVYDMQMAANAGVTAIGVDWGYHAADELRDAGAAYLLSDFAILPGLIDRLRVGRP